MIGRRTADPELDAERYCSATEDEGEERETRCAFCGGAMGVIEGDKMIPIGEHSRFKRFTYLPICGDCVASMEDYKED